MATTINHNLKPYLFGLLALLILGAAVYIFTGNKPKGNDVNQMLKVYFDSSMKAKDTRFDSLVKANVKYEVKQYQDSINNDKSAKQNSNNKLHEKVTSIKHYTTSDIDSFISSRHY
jgi:hypothetical protein